MGNEKIITSYFLLLTFHLFFIMSCATTYEIPINTRTIIIENVPFYPQETYQCGPAALAGVMNFWGINVSHSKIVKEIYSESAKGTLNIDMVMYAQRKGLHALQYAGSIEDLKKNINAGYPVVVLVDYGFSIYQSNHFMVVTGYNEYGIIANSGKERATFIPGKKFLKSWERTKYWTLLIRK
ncbi:MAG: C39 family peptidase [Nitrospirota bacterium]